MTTLQSTINPTTMVMLVTAQGNFPAAGPFRILVVNLDGTSERLMIGSVDGTTWGIAQRGLEGTTPITLQPGAQIYAPPTAGMFSQFAQGSAGAPAPGSGYALLTNGNGRLAMAGIEHDPNASAIPSAYNASPATLVDDAANLRWFQDAISRAAGLPGWPTPPTTLVSSVGLSGGPTLTKGAAVVSPGAGLGASVIGNLLSLFNTGVLTVGAGGSTASGAVTVVADAGATASIVGSQLHIGFSGSAPLSGAAITPSDVYSSFPLTGLAVTGVGNTLAAGVSISVGTAYVVSQSSPRLTAAGGPYTITNASGAGHQLTASRDNYVDWNGTDSLSGFTVTAVTIGAAAPAVATNSIRLAKVTTSATLITAIVDLRPFDQRPVRPVWVNVLDWGMDPTGVSDCTAILNAIIAYLLSGAGGTIYFPYGTYKCTGQVYLPSTGYTQNTIRLEGAGNGGAFGGTFGGATLDLRYDGTTATGFPFDTCVTSGLTVTTTTTSGAAGVVTVADGSCLVGGTRYNPASIANVALTDPGAGNSASYYVDLDAAAGTVSLYAANVASHGQWSNSTTIRLALVTIVNTGGWLSSYVHTQHCHPGKLDLRASNRVTISRLTIACNTPAPQAFVDVIPLVKVTISSVMFHDVTFRGPYAASWQRLPVMDALELGGTGSYVPSQSNHGWNGTNYVSEPYTAYSVFGGYGTTISHCGFQNIHRAIFGRANANGLAISNIWADGSCGAGSKGAFIHMDSIAYVPNYGSMFSRVNMECTHYAHVFRNSNFAQDHKPAQFTISDPNVARLKQPTSTTLTTASGGGATDGNFETVAFWTGRDLYLDGGAAIAEVATVSTIAGTGSVLTSGAGAGVANSAALVVNSNAGLTGVGTTPVSIVIGTGATNEGNIVIGIGTGPPYALILKYPLLYNHGDGEPVGLAPFTLTLAAATANTHSATTAFPVTPTLALVRNESNPGSVQTVSGGSQVPYAGSVFGCEPMMQNRQTQTQPVWDSTVSTFYPTMPLNAYYLGSQGTLLPGPLIATDITAVLSGNSGRIFLGSDQRASFLRTGNYINVNGLPLFTNAQGTVYGALNPTSASTTVNAAAAAAGSTSFVVASGTGLLSGGVLTLTWATPVAVVSASGTTITVATGAGTKFAVGGRVTITGGGHTETKIISGIAGDALTVPTLTNVYDNTATIVGTEVSVITTVAGTTVNVATPLLNAYSTSDTVSQAAGFIAGIGNGAGTYNGSGNGTMLWIRPATGFTGDLIGSQIAGAAPVVFRVNSLGQVGAGGTGPPSAQLHATGSVAGAASTASLKLGSGVLLTTPEAGAVEYDGNRFYATTSALTRRELGLHGDTITATGSISSSTTETVLFTSTLAANGLSAGKMVLVQVLGRLTQQSGTTDTVTIRIRIGGLTGTVLWSATTPASTVLSNAPLDLTLLLTCRTTGTSGSIWTHVKGVFNTTSIEAPGTGAITVNTTIAENIVVTAQWGNASANDTASVDQGYTKII